MLPKILPEGSLPVQPPRPRPELLGPRAGNVASGQETLRETLLEHSSTRPGRRTFQFISAAFIQTMVMAIAVLLPLMYTETIDMRQFTTTLLVAPPPPPPPPRVEARPTRAPKRVFSIAGKLQAPATVPQKIATLKEEPLPSESSAGVAGGVPGGVPGGQLGGVLGGIIGGVASGAQQPAHFVEPPAPAAAKTPVRVRGSVSAPLAIHTRQPDYPLLARHARIQGDVNIDAVIDTEGHVVENEGSLRESGFFRAGLESGQPVALPTHAIERRTCDGSLRRHRALPADLVREPCGGGFVPLALPALVLLANTIQRPSPLDPFLVAPIKCDRTVPCCIQDDRARTERRSDAQNDNEGGRHG